METSPSPLLRDAPYSREGHRLPGPSTGKRGGRGAPAVPGSPRHTRRRASSHTTGPGRAAQSAPHPRHPPRPARRSPPTESCGTRRPRSARCSTYTFFLAPFLPPFVRRLFLPTAMVLLGEPKGRKYTSRENLRERGGGTLLRDLCSSGLPAPLVSRDYGVARAPPRAPTAPPCVGRPRRGRVGGRQRPRVSGGRAAGGRAACRRCGPELADAHVRFARFPWP